MADRSGTTSTTLKTLTGVTAAALVGVVGAGAVFGSNSAADSLEPEARKALDSAGLEQVDVDFEGREAKLSGGSSQDLDRATKIVEGLDGVRWAKADDDKDADSDSDGQTASFTLKRSGTTTRLTGVVKDQATADQLEKAAQDTFGGTIDDQLKIDESVDSSAWGDKLGAALPNLVAVKDLELEAEDSVLEISGDIESEVGRDNVIKLTEEALPDLKIEDDLEIDPGSLSAEDAATLNSSTVYFRPGRAKLSKTSRAKLDKLIDVLNSNPELKINVGGYAEPGTGAKGTRVSQNRVDAVERYLVAAQVAADRLGSKSYGADKQAGDDPRDQKYRRVEFAVKEN